MKNILFSLVCLIGFSAKAQLPPFANVTNVQIDGSGCDAGSANALITDGLNYLSVLYDNFSAEIGKGTANPGSKSAEKRCTINVTVEIPSGWNFQFDSVDYRGYVQVPNSSALAYQVITAEVSGGRGVAFDQHLIKGPRNENYVTTVTNKGNAALQNPNANPLDKLGSLINVLGGLKNSVDKLSAGDLFGCSKSTQQATIKIKSVIGVRNILGQLIKPAVKIVVDSTDASFKQRLHLKWRQCW